MTHVPFSPAAVRAEHDLRTLDELTELGMRRVRVESGEADRLAQAGYIAPHGGPGTDHAMRFATLARLVGQIIALKLRVAAGGSRPSVPGEDLRCAEIRRILHQAAADDPAIQAKPLAERDLVHLDADWQLDALNIGSVLSSGRTVQSVVDSLCRRIGVEPPVFAPPEPEPAPGDPPPPLPAGPEPAKPEAAKPEPGGPDADAPERRGSQPCGPQPGDPETREPEHGEPAPPPRVAAWRPAPALSGAGPP